MFCNFSALEGHLQFYFYNLPPRSFFIPLSREQRGGRETDGNGVGAAEFRGVLWEGGRTLGGFYINDPPDAFRGRGPNAKGREEERPNA